MIGLAAFALALPMCGSETLDACQAYEQYFYSLPCAIDPAAPLDDGIDCPVIASYPCPATQYFQCLTAGTTCNENGQLASDISLCELKCDL